MLNYLKKIAQRPFKEKIIRYLTTDINLHLQNTTGLTTNLLSDDDSYNRIIIKPALTTLTDAFADVLEHIPMFEKRFKKVMYNARNELLLLDNNKVEFVEDFDRKLSSIVSEGFLH